MSLLSFLLLLHGAVGLLSLTALPPPGPPQPPLPAHEEPGEGDGKWPKILWISPLKKAAAGGAEPESAAGLLPTPGSDCPDPTCAGHGACVHSRDGPVCQCEASWAGSSCSYFVGEILPGETVGNLGDPSDLNDAGTLIANQGVCPGDSTASQSCSGHGRCLGGICRCDPGFAGAGCEAPVECPANCNSPSGQCLAGKCVCEPGFFGVSCQNLTCADGCFGHGVCDQGNCSCDLGWTGASCSRRFEPMETHSMWKPVIGLLGKGKAPAETEVDAGLENAALAPIFRKRNLRFQRIVFDPPPSA